MRLQPRGKMFFFVSCTSAIRFVLSPPPSPVEIPTPPKNLPGDPLYESGSLKVVVRYFFCLGHVFGQCPLETLGRSRVSLKKKKNMSSMECGIISVAPVAATCSRRSFQLRNRSNFVGRVSRLEYKEPSGTPRCIVDEHGGQHDLRGLLFFSRLGKIATALTDRVAEVTQRHARRVFFSPSFDWWRLHAVLRVDLPRGELAGPVNCSFVGCRSATVGGEETTRTAHGDLRKQDFIDSVHEHPFLPPVQEGGRVVVACHAA